MKKAPTLFTFLCMLSLGACDHYSDKLAHMQPTKQSVYAYSYVQNIAPASGGEMTFKDYLRNQYLDLATYENNVRRDYRAAKYYTQKIEILDGGQLVAPAALRNFDINDAQKVELQQARADLMESLHIFNIPENRYALALAQTRYDCWVDRAEERPEEANTSLCRMGFNQAMSALVIPDEIFSEEEFYNDFFDVDIGV